jgi:hypothetical protein
LRISFLEDITVRFLFTILTLVLVVVHTGPPPVSALADKNLSGRWRVKFTMPENGEKNLIFVSQANGTGSFKLLDTGPDNKPVKDTVAALWSRTTNDRVSISGEVELPFGTCCRDMGTLMFKGKLGPGNSISGRAVFVSGTVDEENLIGFRSMVGTFTATREPN